MEFAIGYVAGLMDSGLDWKSGATVIGAILILIVIVNVAFDKDIS